MPSSKTGLAESGRFDRSSLPRLLLTLHTSEFERGLRIYLGQRYRHFTFERGLPVISESTLSGDDLRSCLLYTSPSPRDS